MNKAHTTGYVAPVGRYVPPVLFNPYTGEPRDARDIASDPKGMLIVPPGAQLATTNNVAVAPVAPPDPDAAVNEVMELVGTAMDSAMKAGELLLDSHEKFNAQFASAKSLKNPIEAKLRALLAGVSAPAALANTPDSFREWFAKNYPADTIILDPDWHAKSIFRMAQAHARISAPQAQADARDAERWRELCRLLDIAAAADDMEPAFPGSVHEAFQLGGEETAKAIDAAIAAANGE